MQIRNLGETPLRVMSIGPPGLRLMNPAETPLRVLVNDHEVIIPPLHEAAITIDDNGSPQIGDLRTIEPPPIGPRRGML